LLALRENPQRLARFVRVQALRHLGGPQAAPPVARRLPSRETAGDSTASVRPRIGRPDPHRGGPSHPFASPLLVRSGAEGAHVAPPDVLAPGRDFLHTFTIVAGPAIRTDADELPTVKPGATHHPSHGPIEQESSYERDPPSRRPPRLDRPALDPGRRPGRRRRC